VIVLDASVTLASFFEDERTPPVVAAIASVGLSGACGPVHWPLEVANGLRTAIRRRRINTSFRNDGLAQLARLPIEIDAETNVHAWHATLKLADRYGLTPYDAAYLELAQRRRLPLATLDQRLGSAALDAGVESALKG
jgi:predicted nucleic acid-binding protein